MKVLVADDSELIRSRVLERITGLPDIAVVEAVDTPSAMEQLSAFSPDLAVLDIRMPGGGGLNVLAAVKKEFPGVRVMIMTNYPYAQYRRKCLEAGADFFFDKSTEFERMIDIIRKLAEGSDPNALIRRTTAGQLAEAKETLEKIEQRDRDMGLLNLLRPDGPEQAGNEAYLMWEKTFDAIPDLVALLDPDQRIVRVNKAMADRLNVTAAELVGKKCHECLHGTDCPVEECPHAEMLKDRIGKSFELYEPQLDGWFHVTATPIIQENALIGAIHVARDITDRKRAETLTQGTLDALSAHIAIVDQDGTILAVNRPWKQFAKQNKLLSGTEPGTNYLEVCDRARGAFAAEAGVFATGLRAVLCGQKNSFEMEYPCDTETERFWFCGRVTPFSGEPFRWAVVAHENITEELVAREALVRARDVAEEASETKSRFLANMSHELRTPLNAVIGLSELLEDSPLNEEQLDYVKTISDSGENLLRIISDLLDVSKIDLGKLTVKSEPVSVREIVHKAAALLTSPAKEKGLDFSVTVDDEVPETLTADEARLQQVLVNLLNNAVKFTDQGFIRLRVRQKTMPSGSRRIEFFVEDSGKGMNGETLKKIFNPFQQADSSMTREHGGSGLGLAISRNLVELMGGRIGVESTPASGSVFHFYLPDRNPDEAQISPEELREIWRGRCVCIWSDDPGDMRMAEVLLERCGILPRYADSLKAVEERVHSSAHPDAVFCNIDMPGVIEKLAELRDLHGGIPWVALSSWQNTPSDEVLACFSAFADRPVQAQQIYDVLLRLPEEAAPDSRS
jgi:PAS domain S-box-containing protein